MIFWNYSLFSLVDMRTLLPLIYVSFFLTFPHPGVIGSYTRTHGSFPPALLLEDEKNLLSFDDSFFSV